MEKFIIICVILFIASMTTYEANESVTCSGVTNVECGHFELTCGKNERIRHLNQDYAFKDDQTCTMSKKRSKCLSSDDNGCCVYDPADCSETYTRLHVYNLMRECSGKNQCGPLPAPSNILSSCGGNTSTYVRMQYDCILDSDAMSLNICSNRSLGNVEMSLIYDQSTNTLTLPSSCTCETSIIDGYLVEVSYFDVRMMRAHSETGSGSLCSSAVLREEPDNPDSQTKCNGSLSEEYNLKANLHARVPVEENGQLKLILDNLFVNGEDDSPVMVWIHLKAVDGTLVTTCYHREITKPPSTLYTQPVTYSGSTPVVTGAQNNTGESTKPVSDDDNTAVIVGVLVPVIIAAIAAVVLFILWKRRRGSVKKRPARQNSYTSSFGSRSSVAVNNTVYDEIRDLRDTGQLQAFDPTYEVAKETTHGYVNTKQNGTVDRDTDPDSVKEKTNTYQNTKRKNNSDNGHSSKTSKSPFSDLKNTKSQIISFFKRKSNDSLAPPRIVKKPSDASVTSYDHINASMPELRKKNTPASNDERHPYAHTSTIDPTVDSNAKNAALEPKTSSDANARSASPQGVKAVNVGDSYIEFQFGTLDEDGPDLFSSRPKSSEGGETNTKLMKPSRPPPKPNSPKIDKAKATLSASNIPIPTPRPDIEINDQEAYDYADVDDDYEPQVVSSRPNKPGNLTKSDNRNSAMVYSYADVDNDNQVIDTLSPELVYEDVEDTPNTGIRKCSSAQDISCESSGEYEVPVKGNTLRPISDSHIMKPLKDKSKSKSAVKGIENIVNEAVSPVGLGNVVKELKEVEELPDLSDPEKLPKELKYANLGLRSPKNTQKAGKDAIKNTSKSAGLKKDNNKKKEDTKKTNQIGSKQQNQVTEQEPSESKHESSEVTKDKKPATRKGVLSLAKKFEVSDKL